MTENLRATRRLLLSQQEKLRLSFLASLMLMTALAIPVPESFLAVQLFHLTALPVAVCAYRIPRIVSAFLLISTIAYSSRTQLPYLTILSIHSNSSTFVNPWTSTPISRGRPSMARRITDLTSRRY
ncbi:hypothetical protein BT69DRAFT_980614 [Atractiella rhizophila]|nr:hypothetical protein BT69DRAFT_980614 [Atractiella rhizophila]